MLEDRKVSHPLGLCGSGTSANEGEESQTLIWKYCFARGWCEEEESID